jgi:hypothetical protein
MPGECGNDKGSGVLSLWHDLSRCGVVIVNYTRSGWEIITQRAHGLLAAQLAWYWKEKYQPERWVETVLAIAEHDDTGIEFEAENLLTSSGGPVHYAMRAFDPEHCRKLSLASRAKSRHIALLSAMHLIFLYGQEAKTNKQAAVFMQEQRKFLVRLRRELGITKAEADRTYALMQWCDALSLLICKHALQPEQRMTEVSKGPDKRSYEVCHLGPAVLSVVPWPFAANKFTIGVESRLIHQLSFSDMREFREALYAAPVRESRYELRVSAKR